MSDIQTILPEELDATANGTEVVEEPTTEVPEAKTESAEDTKPLSLSDAVAKAMAKHTPAAEKPDTALPVTDKAAVQPTDGKVTDPITGRVSEPMKPPAGWTPALREKWGSIDPTVQKFIRDNEVHVSKKLQEVADERKLASEFKDIAAPYEAMLRGFNTTAAAHAKDLFNLSHTLNTGSPQTRAQVLANMIHHFQPDPAALSHYVSNGSRGTQAPPTIAPPPKVEELVQQALDARDAKTQEATIASDIEKFAADPKNTYYEDVRDMMGKLIQAGVVDAPTMPELFKKAYDLACSQHPEIAPILARQSQAPAAAPAVKAVQSIKPSLGTGAKGKAPARSVDLNDAVTQAFRANGLLT